MHLVVQPCDFLLAGCREKERVHLGLQCVVHLHINVIAGSLLLVIGVHTIITTQFSVFSIKLFFIVFG